MKRSDGLMKRVASGLCIAGAGLALGGWVWRWWLARGRGEGEVGGRIVPGRRRTLTPCPVQVRRRLSLPIAVRPGRLRLLQFLAGLVAACLAATVYLLVEGPDADSIMAGTAVFIALVEGFLTWLFPALFAEVGS